MKRHPRYLTPDPAEGTPPADPQEAPPSPAPAPPEVPGGPTPSQAPPPAAKTVIEGRKTEREVALERDLKARETRISELEDQNRQLKEVKPTPPREKKSWLSGSTFFHED